MSVTRLGVSLENVVATIDSPPSHHGTDRPDAKNSDVFFPARRPKKSAGTKQMASVASRISQSSVASCMKVSGGIAAAILTAMAGRRAVCRLRSASFARLAAMATSPRLA